MGCLLYALIIIALGHCIFFCRTPLGNFIPCFGVNFDSVACSCKAIVFVPHVMRYVHRDFVGNVSNHSSAASSKFSLQKKDVL